MSVTVDTGETELNIAEAGVAKADTTPVVVDTAEDDLDTVIPQTAAPLRSPPRKPAEPLPPPVEVVEPKKPKMKRHHHRPPPPPAAPKDPNNVQDYLDQRSDFAAALHRTVPVSTGKDEANAFSSSDTEVSSIAEEDTEQRKGKWASPKHKKEESSEEESDSSASSTEEGPKKKGDDEAEEDSESGSSSEEGDRDAAGGADPGTGNPEEDEYIEKMKLMEEIKEYAKMGAVPPQHPTFEMPVTLLRKIRDYQMSVVDEIMGVGFIGMGWVQVIGLVEKLNQRYDPFARAFGTGLKLNGAKGAVEQNIHLYEKCFKHIYRKLNLGKNKELSPWVQLVSVTIQILSQVHMHNMEQEMMEEARRMASNPTTAEQAERLRRMHEQRKSQKDVPPAPAPPAPAPSPALAQPTMKPVDEAIVADDEADEPEPKKEEEPPRPNTPVELKQPPAAADEPVVVDDTDDEKKTEPTKVEELDDDDDDVVVEIPKARGRKRARSPPQQI